MVLDPLESRSHADRLPFMRANASDNGGWVEPGGTTVPQTEEPRLEGQPAVPPPGPATILLVEDEPSVRLPLTGHAGAESP